MKPCVMCGQFLLAATLCGRLLAENPYYYVFGKKEEDIGTLAGDVQNWAMLIQNYVIQLANEGIKREFTQGLFDTATYTLEHKDGVELIRNLKKSLGNYFTMKKRAVQRLAAKVVELYDSYKRLNQTSRYKSLDDFPLGMFRDSDNPSRLPPKMNYFKQSVSSAQSSVKISDEVPRKFNVTLDTVMWTSELESVFQDNAKEDSQIRWQYFGSNAGLARIFPGREWDTNFAGFYNDYDPRVRPWYIAATSGPKDVVIILDCSLSMKGEKFRIAQAVAKTVINTLTRQDYVNVVCARASHWDEVGKWHLFKTEVLSCQQDKLVQATLAHRKDLIEKTYKLKPGGTSELEKGFEKAYNLVDGRPKTGCQTIFVFVTDGLDTDGEQVRCGPGYYTRSGYVPGPICKYNWTKAWDMSETKSRYKHPETRIFSYLTYDKGEAFPGKLACQHRGSMRKLQSGENLISEMSNYFDFLSRNAKNSHGLWTSPYLDSWGLGLMVTHAIPVISKVDGTTIGVVGVDCPLEVIDNFLSKHQWGTVYSFLINKQGESIFHPRLKPSTNLVDDPIFIPIEQLEMSKGEPADFVKVMNDMKAGKTSYRRIENARKYLGKPIAITYYYAALNDSDYAFAFCLSDTDKIFRRAQEPQDTLNYGKSYYNLIIKYNSTEARKAFPGTFEYLKVIYNSKKYPNLRVSNLHSSIFLAPKCHCDANKYFYDSDLAMKTVVAHTYMNSIAPDVGCEKGSVYERGIRADVLISQPVEKLWRSRSFEGIEDVKWTYVGMRSGVFRTYPAHRSSRAYDPTKRSWYKRSSSAPSKTSISTAYMDAAGVGKIITVSQAVFEGMTNRSTKDCLEISKTGPWPGGCRCEKDKDCTIGFCYVSKAKGQNRKHPRCATERVEAVTSLDILYDRFHDITMKIMEASDEKKSCGLKYRCPNGEPGCQTRCYLFDKGAKLITDPDFITASALDESKYKGITMGKKEGEVMKDLIYRHKFFRRSERLDFQGVCHISPYAPKVTLEGFPKNPEERDDYYQNRGSIPKFSNEFGCIQDVVGYSANESALGPSGMITGNVSGPCMSGFYYVTILPKTNLFLLVIENWMRYESFFNFNCRIAQSIVNSGAYRIINGTCAHTETSSTTLAQAGMCPPLRNINIPCSFNNASALGSLPFSYFSIVYLVTKLYCVFFQDCKI